MEKERILGVVGRGVALFGMIFVVISVISYSPEDWPTPGVWPHPTPAMNDCGAAGAMVAYQLFYFLGAGTWPFIGFLAVWTLILLFRGRIADPILRGIGLALLVVVVAAMEHRLALPGGVCLPEGRGGIVGIAAGRLLVGHFSAWGTGVLLAAGFFVGIILCADQLVVGALDVLAWLGRRVLRGMTVVTPVPAPAGAPPETPPEEDLPRINPHRLAAPVVPVKPQKEDFLFNEEEDNNDLAVETPEDPAIQPDASDDEQSPPDEAPDPEKALPGAADKKTWDDYQFPSLDFLKEAEQVLASMQEKVVREKAVVLEQTLAEFNITAKVVEIDTGPSITLFELELAPGTKVSQVTALSNDVARAMRASLVRIVAPIPGKHTIGIEVPNAEKERVRLRELMQLASSKTKKMQLPVWLGKDASGRPLVTDLTAMPHLLIAGATGSGKSVCINGIIMSILYTQRPDAVKLILIDPKIVELASFKAIPHLMSPVVNEMARVEPILEWLTTKMDERYEMLAEVRVRNIVEFNALGRKEILRRLQPTSPEEEAGIVSHLPYVVVIVDELADLMMQSGKEVERYIIRLAQKSRAVGIHLILATQRPSVNVVTGLIKSNLPGRVSFRVASRQESRIVLDQNGAETLLGQGDMLLLEPGASKLIRAQGVLVDETEIRKTITFLKSTAEPEFNDELTKLTTAAVADSDQRDPLFDDAVRIVLKSKRGSVSLLQRRLNVGYSRAAKLIEQMADAGIVGAYKGSQAREVYMTLEEFDATRARMDADEEDGYRDLAEQDDSTLPENPD